MKRLHNKGQSAIEFYLVFIAVALLVSSFMYIVKNYQETVYEKFNRNRVYVVGSRIATHLDEFMHIYSKAVIHFSTAEILRSGDKIYPNDTKEVYDEGTGAWYIQINLVPEVAGTMEKPQPLLKIPVEVPTLMTDYHLEFTDKLNISIKAINATIFDLSRVETGGTIFLIWW